MLSAWTLGNTLTVVAIVVGVLVAVIGWVLVRHWRKRDKAEDEKAAVDKALGEAHPSFAAQVRAIPAGQVTANPVDPVDVSTDTAGVWVHAVELSWRYSSEPEGTWRLEGGRCEPTRGEGLPREVTPLVALGLTWPGELPPERAQRTEEVWVTWSLWPDPERGTRRTQATGHARGSTGSGWQYT